MNKRIKMLRKSLGLTQQNFANRIGMKQNSIALIESGRNTSDQTILSICREFNVNEEWLRTGKGEMFNQSNNTLLQEIIAEYNLDDFQTKMLEIFLKLDEPRRKAITDYIRLLINSEKINNKIEETEKKPNIQKEEVAETEENSNMTVDEITRQIAKLERLLEKKLEEKSLVSSPKKPNDYKSMA